MLPDIFCYKIANLLPVPQVLLMSFLISLMHLQKHAGFNEIKKQNIDQLQCSTLFLCFIFRVFQTLQPQRGAAVQSSSGRQTHFNGVTIIAGSASLLDRSTFLSRAGIKRCSCFVEH